MLKLLLCLCFFLCGGLDPPEVLTNLGHVKGKWLTSRDGSRYLAFYGLPYAKPPVGHLRFKDPIAFGSWSGVIDATRPRDDCPQWPYQSVEQLTEANVTGSEDCLYLNIYTPDTRYGSLLPVIVYFYGGAFVTGSAVEGHGATYLMDERIVLVTVSYRLGPLGFLSFEDEVLPGNMGLKDQVLALKWVRQNIPAFGGHPKRITIMGESAGATSVNLHMLSPLTTGLFQQAISMSGTAYIFSSWLRAGEARNRGLALARAVGCNSSTTTQETLDCLRTVPFQNITFALNNFMDEYRYPLIYYLPVVDSTASKPFLPKEPNKIEQANVPWLVGVSSGEGLLETARYQIFPSFSWEYINQNFSDYIETALFMHNIPIQDVNLDQLRHFYFGNQPIDERSFANMTNLISDGFLIYPTYIGLKRKTGPLYYYYFDYLGENSYADQLGSKRLMNASYHTDECIYIWDQTNVFPPLKGDDLILSKSLVKLWTNFAKYGSPTTKESVITWERYNKNHRYLHICNDGFSVRKDLLENRMKFWEQFYPY